MWTKQSRDKLLVRQLLPVNFPHHHERQDGSQQTKNAVAMPAIELTSGDRSVRQETAKKECQSQHLRIFDLLVANYRLRKEEPNGEQKNRCDAQNRTNGEQNAYDSRPGVSGDILVLKIIRRRRRWGANSRNFLHDFAKRGCT